MRSSGPPRQNFLRTCKTIFKSILCIFIWGIYYSWLKSLLLSHIFSLVGAKGQRGTYANRQKGQSLTQRTQLQSCLEGHAVPERAVSQGSSITTDCLATAGGFTITRPSSRGTVCPCRRKPGPGMPSPGHGSARLDCWPLALSLHSAVTALLSSSWCCVGGTW